MGRLTTDGAFSEFAVPTPLSLPNGITSGGDGSIWFTEQNTAKIGKASLTGVITEFKIPSDVGFIPFPLGIAAGPDGNVWFTDAVLDRIGRITPAGTITMFEIRPLPGPLKFPFGI